MRSPSRHSSLPRNNSRGSGFTLVEVIVAGFLLVFVLFYSSSMLVASLGYQAVQQNQTDLQRSAMDVLTKLADELSEASPYSVKSETSPAGIIFSSPRDEMGRFVFDNSALVLWQRYICYYVDTNATGEPCLVRKESAFTPTTTVTGIPTSVTTAWFKTLNVPRRLLGTSVTGLTTSGTNPIVVSLTCNHSARGRKDEVTVDTKVFLRNDFQP